MKKSFLAMLLVGGTMNVFAQTTQTDTTRTTTQGNQLTGTTQQSTGVTGDPATTTEKNVSNMTNTATDTVPANTQATTTSTGTWNGVSSDATMNSTSWAPEKDPSWGWNNYGVWQGNSNMNASTQGTMGTTGVNGSVDANVGTTGVNMNTDASMQSTGAYSAYGTAVPYLPNNVQMRFGQDFPAVANNQFKWNQYGDWFHTYQMNNGRLTQYFYDNRGSGYSIALPKLHSYVPENIITSALNKFGSSLYSISAVRDTAGNDVYQVGLLQRGQLSTHFLNESGASVGNYWRTEEVVDSLQTSQSNAAMGSDGTMQQNSVDQSTSTTTDTQSQTEMTEGQTSDETKTKVKIENADGSETKIKTKDGKTKVKTKGADDKHDQ